MKVFRVNVDIDITDYIIAEDEDEAKEVLSDCFKEVLEGCEQWDTFTELHEAPRWDEQCIPYGASQGMTLEQIFRSCEVAEVEYVDPNQLDLNLEA